MNTFWIIIFGVLAVIQLARMIWAARYISHMHTGDEDITLLQKLFFIVFWPITWFGSCLEGLE